MLQLSTQIALCVLFVHVSTWEGFINEWVNKATFSWRPWATKPIFDCPVCMTPWWGTGFYLLMYYSGTAPYIHPFGLIPVLFCAAGINAVLSNLITYVKDLYDQPDS